MDWRIGENVPWSVAWTGEQAFAVRPSQDFPGMMEITQRHNPGVGEPLFAGIHVDRHRRAMIDQLCHVCGRPTPEDDRYIFPVAAGGFVTLHDGSIGYGCNVPPLHLACARRAGADCPHLGRLHDSPAACIGDEGRIIHRTDVTPGMEALARTLPAGLEVVFSCYRLYGEAFTREVERLRRDWEQATFARRGRVS